MCPVTPLCWSVKVKSKGNEVLYRFNRYLDSNGPHKLNKCYPSVLSVIKILRLCWDAYDIHLHAVLHVFSTSTKRKKEAEKYDLHQVAKKWGSGNGEGKNSLSRHEDWLTKTQQKQLHLVICKLVQFIAIVNTIQSKKKTITVRGAGDWSYLSCLWP